MTDILKREQKLLQTPEIWCGILAKIAWGWKFLEGWEVAIIKSKERFNIANCSRQLGKSHTAMLKATHTAILNPNSLQLVVAEQRQSNEDLRRARDLCLAYDEYLSEVSDNKLGLALVTDNKTSLELPNGSRIIALPGNEKIRGYANPLVVYIDEAARLSDEVFIALEPMITMGTGQLFLLSTPNGPCYSEDTDIMTESGWKNFKELNYDDKIACLIDEKVQFHYPQLIIVQKSDRLLHFKSTQTDLLVTPEHKMWVKIQKGKWKLQYAKDLLNRKTDLYFKKDYPWDLGKEIDTITIPAKEWNRKHWSNGVTYRVVKPKMVVKADDFLEFLGHVLSDGCASARTSRVDITQLDTDNMNKIVACVIRLGFSYRIYKNSSKNESKRISVYHTQLNAYLRDFKTQGLPQFIKDASKRQLRIFLDAFYVGDGLKAERRRIFAGIYPKLQDELQEIILKLGYTSNITRHNKGKDKIVTIGVPNPHKYETYLNPIQIINKLCNVYSCTVPNGLVFVRRNGKACWCGNSGFYYKEWNNPRYTLRLEVPWFESERLKDNAGFRKDIERARMLYGEAYVKQEFECGFLDTIGTLFPQRELERSIDDETDVFTDVMDRVNKKLGQI